jgi:SAM-dependent methyltransferase
MRDEWRSVAGGWRRWEPLFQSFTWPVALKMAAVTHVGDGRRVLDVGCGIGDPTLQVAVLVGPHGRVLGIDLVEDMIATARERAAALGLAHVEFRAGDAATVELPPAAFDVVLGRWSMIYLEDVRGTLARLRAALVPGGRIAITGWAPPDTNPWVTIPMDAVASVRPLPPADPGVPGIFHLSADGALAEALTAVGFRDVHQERIRLSQFARDPGEYWAMLTEMGGPLAALLVELGPEARDQVARRVAESISRYRTGTCCASRRRHSWRGARPSARAPSGCPRSCATTVDTMITIRARAALTVLLALSPIAPAWGRSVTVRVPSFEVAPFQNREICTYVPLPTRKALELSEVRIVHQGGTPDFVTHHLIVYRYSGPHEAVANLKKSVVDDTACLNVGTGNPADLQIVATSQAIQSRQRMPTGTALRLAPTPLGRGSRQAVGLILNSHWINSAAETRKARAKITLVLTSAKKVKRELKPIFEVVANGFLKVPPGETVPVSWTWGPGLVNLGTFLGGSENPSGPACVTMLISHMHERGTLFTIDFVANGGARQRLYENTAYNHPPTLLLDPPLLVRPGETLEYRCVHDNATNPRLGCEETPGETPGKGIGDTLIEIGFDFTKLTELSGAAKRCTQLGPNAGECPSTDPAFPNRTFTGNCVPANLVFGFKSWDDMCIMPGYYYDADPAAGPGHECDL